MSKVICDVCGTAYAETAAQCPICGSAKASANQTAATGSQQGSTAASGYTYVKGGRFSKSNVRKRNKKGKTLERRPAPERQPQKKEAPKQEEQANRGLVAIVVILLLAIIAVVIYIAVRILGPSVDPGQNTKPPQQTQSTNQTQESTLPEIPCTKLELSHKVIELSNAGDFWQISVTPTPADTTDQIIMTSADERVATVSETGKVVAVGGGETVITITCGSITVECPVVCSFGDPTDPTQESTEPTKPVVELKFNTPFKDADSGKYDTTLSRKGETWKAYTGDISPLEIEWISDDPNVCTIVNGVVTAVGPGKTEVHAQYQGTTVSCIVRCAFSVPTEPTEPAETQPADPANPTQPTEPEVKMSDADGDVTIAVGESFTLTLKKGTEVLEVEWKADAEGFVTIEGNKITGVAAKLAGVNVSTTYEGQTYTCVVRISG